MLLLPYFIQAEVHEFCSCGFPHSDICGSKDACSSPQLFAACHVLHRLEVPRHPPCALSSLTIKFTHEQQTDLKSNFRSEINSLSEKLQVSYSYCACTVKLALCVSLLSDITPLRSENSKSETSTRDVGQQSIFDYQRPLYYFRPSVETSTFKGRLEMHSLLHLACRI